MTSFKQRYSALFKSKHCFIECGEGWSGILEALCFRINNHLGCPENEKLAKDFSVLQVKEKFGALRFYTSVADEKIDEWIRQAEELSSITCEVCGQPGKIKGPGWLKCYCEKHHEEREKNEL